MDNSLLTAALVGYEIQLQKIQNAIAEIRNQLGHESTGSKATVVNGTKPRRHMSAAARKRIAAGQRKRWAAFHESHEVQAAPKRVLSAAREVSTVQAGATQLPS